MSRRALKAINWAAITERVPESEKHMLSSLKSKTEMYLRKVYEYPEAAPKIDWAHYKKLISVPGMVDSFQKQYETMQIPFPPDNYTKILEDEQKNMATKVENYKQNCDKAIENYEIKLNLLKDELPMEEMTMEEFVMTNPTWKIGTASSPSIWPHTPEFQPENIALEKKEAAH